MKKLLAILLAMVMMFVLIAACGNGDDEPPPRETREEPLTDTTNDEPDTQDEPEEIVASPANGVWLLVSLNDGSDEYISVTNSGLVIEGNTITGFYYPDSRGMRRDIIFIGSSDTPNRIVETDLGTREEYDLEAFIGTVGETNIRFLDNSGNESRSERQGFEVITDNTITIGGVERVEDTLRIGHALNNPNRHYSIFVRLHDVDLVVPEPTPYEFNIAGRRGHGNPEQRFAIITDVIGEDGTIRGSNPRDFEITFNEDGTFTSVAHYRVMLDNSLVIGCGCPMGGPCPHTPEEVREMRLEQGLQSYVWWDNRDDMEIVDEEIRQDSGMVMNRTYRRIVEGTFEVVPSAVNVTYLEMTVNGETYTWAINTQNAGESISFAADKQGFHQATSLRRMD